MPVKSVELGKLRGRDEHLSELRERLVTEWNSNSDAPEPLIYEEQRQGRVVHVYVVWDEWAALSDRERSEVITDAFLEVKDEDAITDLAIAMGVTRDEAKRMGLPLD